MKNLPKAVFTISDASFIGALIAIKEVDTSYNIRLEGFKSEQVTSLVTPAVSVAEQPDLKLL